LANPLPTELATSLTTPELALAGARLGNWIQQQGLLLDRTDAPDIPSFQVYLRLGRVAHPLLSLQPHPHNPDIPFQKFRAMSRSPLRNGGARRTWVEKLNALLPEAERKDVPKAAEKMFKLRWPLFADPQLGPSLIGYLEALASRIRQGA
jgi:hypothetical protein